MKTIIKHDDQEFEISVHEIPGGKKFFGDKPLFVVNYGLETKVVSKDNLAQHLGNILIHSMECAGKLTTKT